MLFPRRFEKIGIPPQSKVYKVAKEMSKYFSVLIVFRFISKSKRIILFYFRIRVEMSISLKQEDGTIPSLLNFDCVSIDRQLEGNSTD